MRRVLLVPICLCSCLAQSRLNLSGSVSGTLTGEDGSHIVGGRVTLLLVPQNPEAKLRQTLWSAVSGAGGAFQFGGLSEGTYQLCAQVPASAWLNPCEWGLQPPAVSLSNAQPAASFDFVLKKGAAVPIRIDDPGHFLSQNEGKTPGAHLFLGVRNDASAICPVPLLSRDANGRNYQIVVPFNATVNLVVHSSFFHLSNASGSPIGATGPSVAVTVPAGQQPAPIRFVVTGGGH